MRSNEAGEVSASKHLSEGYAAIFATIVIWSTPSLFQFYLNRFYDPFAQNFYRYSVAFLAILPFAIIRGRRSRQKIDWKALGICLPAAFPNVVTQIGQVVALHYMGPGVYAVFIRSSVVITALLVLIFFPEERWMIQQWQFQAGTLLGLLGAAGVLWFQPGLSGGKISLAGCGIAFLASCCWALYGVLVKRPSARLGSIRSFTLIAFLTSALLLPLTCLFGNAKTPLQVGAHVNWILVVSAVFCIALAHVLYYVAIREIGVALSQTLHLVTPLGALALSAWIFHERLSTGQVWSAAILLVGTFLAMRVKPAAVTVSTEST